MVQAMKDSGVSSLPDNAKMTFLVVTPSGIIFSHIIPSEVAPTPEFLNMRGQKRVHGDEPLSAFDIYKDAVTPPSADDLSSIESSTANSPNNPEVAHQAGSSVVRPEEFSVNGNGKLVTATGQFVLGQDRRGDK